ncbi:MAG: o-succinylbenzoate--CoA ligase [Sporolactobacillus sp.]
MKKNLADTPVMMPLFLHQRAQLTPERLAYLTEDRQLNFRELDQLARRFAASLADRGVHSGETIAVLQENSIAFVLTQHALMYLGAVCVPLNLRLTAEELTSQVRDSTCSQLITDSANQEKAERIIAASACRLLMTRELIAESNRAEKRPNPSLRQEVCLDEPCTIIYTSGTTGHPKGVVLTYGNHWWNANASLINLGLRQEDVWLCCVPLFHVSGLSILMKNVIYGMPVFLCRRFIPEQINERIFKGQVTHVSLVASTLQRVLDCSEDDPFPSSFRCVLLGGGPVPSILSRRCLERNIPVYQTYGMTETASQCVTLPPEYMITKAGSAGKPLFPLQLRIMSDAQEASSGEPGEIQIKGPTVFNHYLNRDQATREAFTDGWFRTGDIGYRDADGFLFVLDRRQDLIISGGENVYPAEVESALRLDPNVTGAGVIGIADEQWGQVPVAFVSMHWPDQFSETVLIKACRKHLAGYKVPKHIRLIDQIPENASHKVLRRKLQEIWNADHSVKK